MFATKINATKEKQTNMTQKDLMCVWVCVFNFSDGGDMKKITLQTHYPNDDQMMGNDLILM